LPKAKRDALIAGPDHGEVQVLTSCDLIFRGHQGPWRWGAVILLRPTASLVMHLQQIGRGLRPAPGKPPLIVLDHVDNLDRHGLPEAKRASGPSMALKNNRTRRRAARSARAVNTSMSRPQNSAA
jgi:DNA repair protein RadD